jgi:hypothetical protein
VSDVQAITINTTQQVVTVSPVAAPAATSGMSQSQADARYIRLTQIDAASGVAGLDASRFVGEDRLPLPPITLTVLFDNKLA